MHILVALFSFCVFISKNDALKTGKYYEKVWNDTIQQARNWKRPLQNTEFKSALYKTCTYTNTYDFIIIGAGSAGAVIANRLSEIEDFSILLLEAGGDENDGNLIPLAFSAITNTKLNWGYLTTPQKNACLGTINQQCDFARGKVLGGCSSINAMIHVRGNKLDFQTWSVNKNNKWSYENILPYFIKSENTSGLHFNKKYRGVKGPLKITFSGPPSQIDFIIKGNQELGLKHLDYNGENEIGVSQIQANVNEGKRWSTNQGYLQPITNTRKNLKIITHALVTKINFDQNNKAVSVNVLHNDQCMYFNATKEVIVSAGAVNSPQLLMLSGIGPKKDLENLNIITIADLPVGKNMIEHNTVFNIPIIINRNNTVTSLEKLFEEYSKGKGDFSYPAARSINFIKLVQPFKDGIPDVEVIYTFPSSHIPRDISMKQFLYNEYMNESLLGGNNGIFLNFIQLHPFSRGEIGLITNNPLDFPKIDPKYLEDPRDIEIVYKAIKKALRLLKTSAFRNLGAKVAKQSIPACDKFKNERLHWYCIIRYKTAGIYHPVGTCRMGNNTKTSVVDENLRIHNFPNTRIVDASIFPDMTSGHINSVVVAVAEKISDEIKQYYKK